MTAHDTPLILIVDNDAKSIKLAKDLLEFSGFTTLLAADGAEGVRLARDRHPTLIVMDMHLPIMDGVQATRILKTDPDTARIPILVVTASVMPRDRSQITAAGCDAFLSKPINIKEFLHIAATLVGNGIPPAGGIQS